jgi:CHAT domain-containing protein
LTFAVHPNPRSITRLPRVSLLGWALVLVAACTRGESAETEAPRGMVAELARVVGPAPTLGPRLSIAREPSGCASEAGCRETGTPSRRVNTVAARASQAARASVAPDALHASALVDLLWADDEGTSLRRSIQYLQTAARLDPRPAPILADLSAAHLVRAERANSPRDLLEAVETAERALQKDPANRAALFNRALGLERFGLMGEAGRSWRAYLAVDSTSDWADAARKRLAEVSRVPVLPKAPSANATDAELAAYAVADPQGARTMGWDKLLGEWGAAVLANDGAKAADRLHRAEVLGNALERAGRDATLADAVRSIRVHAASEGNARRLAAAHRTFAEARAAYQEPAFKTAAPLFENARAADGLSPALAGWAAAYGGAALVLAGEIQRGKPLIQAALAGGDPRRNPALSGRARSFLATTLLRTDGYEQALFHAEKSATDLNRAGERDHEGGAMAIAAAAAFELSDPVGGYSAARSAIELLDPNSASVALHNLIFSLAETAAADGYLRTAIRVQSEGVEVALRTGREMYVIEARLARARIAGRAGDYSAAERDVSASRALIPRIPDANAQTWFLADLRLTEAETTLRSKPERATVVLDSAIHGFEEFDAPVRILPAIVSRARHKVARNDIPGAMADLNRAVILLGSRRDAVVNPTLRASLIDAAREVFDEAATVHLDAGRTEDALRLVERGRAAVSGRHTSSERSIASRPGEVVLAYTLLRDQLVIWSIANRNVAVAKVPVDTTEVRFTIHEVRSALETGVAADDHLIQARLARLYDLLIRPVGPRITNREHRLVLVADGELSAVPFPALRNRRTARYLVQDHIIRFATSVHEAARPPAVRGKHGPVLIVSDPAFDLRAHPEIEQLPEAAAEARNVAESFPGATILSGAEATPRALRAALPSASLMHYAGHAVFDDDRPENSFLLLASEPGRTGGGRLTAATLASMNLQRTELVVLSTCQSIRSTRGRAGGFSGLAGSLMAAGVSGVVGSLWKVDDVEARALISGFHLNYKETRDAPRALRLTQLRMLQSRSADLGSPSAWAGFRYSGR